MRKGFSALKPGGVFVLTGGMLAYLTALEGDHSGEPVFVTGYGPT